MSIIRKPWKMTNHMQQYDGPKKKWNTAPNRWLIIRINYIFHCKIFFAPLLSANLLVFIASAEMRPMCSSFFLLCAVAKTHQRNRRVASLFMLLNMLVTRCPQSHVCHAARGGTSFFAANRVQFEHDIVAITCKLRRATSPHEPSHVPSQII